MFGIINHKTSENLVYGWLPQKMSSVGGNRMALMGSATCSVHYWYWRLRLTGPIKITGSVVFDLLPLAPSKLTIVQCVSFIVLIWHFRHIVHLNSLSTQEHHTSANQMKKLLCEFINSILTDLDAGKLLNLNLYTCRTCVVIQWSSSYSYDLPVITAPFNYMRALKPNLLPANNKKAMNSEKRNKQNESKSTNPNSQTWPLNFAEVNLCFPRGQLRS